MAVIIPTDIATDHKISVDLDENSGSLFFNPLPWDHQRKLCQLGEYKRLVSELSQAYDGPLDAENTKVLSIEELGWS